MIEHLRIDPGEPAGLRTRDTRDTLGLPDKEAAKDLQGDLVERIVDLQERLWAEDEQALLVVLQGMDTAGKDGTIRRLTTGVNPQGVRVEGFKAPSDNELDRDYLWRLHRVTPRRGEIGIFNRSHYEEVLVVRGNENPTNQFDLLKVVKIVPREEVTYDWKIFGGELGPYKV